MKTREVGVAAHVTFLHTRCRLMLSRPVIVKTRSNWLPLLLLLLPLPLKSSGGCKW
jgi:hypothetical protein